MNKLKRCTLAVVTVLAVGCGGGGSTTNSGAATTFSFVGPKVGSQRLYAKTTVDNANNTINQTLRNTITGINADGSFVYVQDDPTGTSLVVNGTTYSTLTLTITVNGSGQMLGYSYIPSGGTQVSCTVSPHGPGPTFPLTVGQTWTLNNITACGNGSIAHYQSGSVVGVESVTVPAGTFNSVKLQSVFSWTDSSGTTRTETTTSWLDVNTSILVKIDVAYVYSGTALSSGYPITTTTALQSQA
jgi:hypothetical protein